MDPAQLSHPSFPAGCSMMSELLRRREAVEWRTDGRSQSTRATPNETPVGISFNSRPHTVLMASPADLEDLAVGFTLTENIAEPAQIRAVHISTVAQGLKVDVQLDIDARASKARRRTLEGRSSCGLCGVQRLADAVRPLPTLTEGPVFTHQAVQRAVDSIGDHQALRRATRATHAAAFAGASGAIQIVREDVGRHNALDKLAGALHQARLPAGEGFIVVTSRCSFEMIEKTARIGVAMIVAVSAPTDLAIRMAAQANLTLVALARADGHSIFTGAARLQDACAASLHG